MSLGEKFFNWTDKQSPERLTYGLVVFVFAFWACFVVGCRALYLAVRS